MCGFSQRWAAAFAALLVGAGTAPCYPFEDLLKGVSDRANVVILANIRGLQRSSLGVSQNWAEKRRRDYLGGLVDLPPTVSRVVVGEQLDTSSLHPVWRIAMIDLSEPMTPAQLLSRESGTQDKVSGLPVVVSPRGRAFVFLSNKLVAELDTVNRQDIARWVSSYNRSTKPALSRYLQEAAEGIRPGAQITLAMDLGEVFDVEGMRKRLKEAKPLEGKRVDVEALAQTLAGTRGVKLILEVDKVINGEIRLDFSGSADPLRGIGKDLLLHAMQSMGAGLDDLNSWNGSVDGNAYLLRGVLSERGARMLLSSAAGTTSGPAYAELAAEPPPPNPKAVPSQKYFRSVTALLDELNAGQKGKTVSQRGYWYQQYAAKIDALPILNVDPDLLEFGGSVSSTLRAMANIGQIAKDQNAMIQQQQIDNAWLTVPTTVGYGGGYGYGPYGYGGYGWNYTVPTQARYSNVRQVANLCSQNAATEKAFREATWKNIAEATQTIRRKMVQKYQVEF